MRNLHIGIILYYYLDGIHGYLMSNLNSCDGLFSAQIGEGEERGWREGWRGREGEERGGGEEGEGRRGMSMLV